MGAGPRAALPLFPESQAAASAALACGLQEDAGTPDLCLKFAVSPLLEMHCPHEKRSWRTSGFGLSPKGSGEPGKVAGRERRDQICFLEGASGNSRRLAWRRLGAQRSRWMKRRKWGHVKRDRSSHTATLPSMGCPSSTWLCPLGPGLMPSLEPGAVDRASQGLDQGQ